MLSNPNGDTMKMNFICGRTNTVQFSECEKYKIKRVTKPKKGAPGGMGTFLSYSSNREWEVSYRERVEDDFSPKISFKNMLDAKMWAEDHKNAKEG